MKKFYSFTVLMVLLVGFSFSSCVTTKIDENHEHKYVYNRKKDNELNNSYKDVLLCKCGESQIVSHKTNGEYIYRGNGRDEALCIYCGDWVGYKHEHTKKDNCDHICKTCGESVTGYSYYVYSLEHYKKCLLCYNKITLDESCSGYINSNKTGWKCTKCNRIHTCEFEQNGPLWKCKECTNSVWK